MDKELEDILLMMTAEYIRKQEEVMRNEVGLEVRSYIVRRGIVPITSVRHFTDERIEKAVGVCCASLHSKTPGYEMLRRLEVIGLSNDGTYVAEIVEDLRNRRMDAGERFEMVKRYSCRGVTPILLLLDAELVRRIAKVICKAFGTGIRKGSADQ